MKETPTSTQAMKKTFLFVILFLLVQVISFGQLTGNLSIPGSYANIALAIADLNAQGVGEGGVTFNIAAGHSETFTSPVDGLITVSNSLPSRPIVFRKSGGGANPKIYAPYGEGYNDYIICIAGTDYLTLDGLDLYESPNNTDTDTQAEYGIVFAKADADTSGTQHCTIQNCTISLERTNIGTIGIVLRNWKGSAVGTLLSTINSTRKANSYNSIQGNYITNCFNGIYMYGSAAVPPYETYDQGNDIGSVAGNTITNFGGSSGSCYGIYSQYENGFVIANNRITGVVSGGSCYGMEFQVTAGASLDLYGNYISIQYNGTGTFFGIRNYMGNVATTSNIVNIHHNIITRCTSPNTSGSVSYMEIGQGGPMTSVYDNWIVNNEYGSPSKTSNGEVHYIYIGYLPTTLGTANIYNNRVSSNTRYQSPSASGGITRYMRFGPQCLTVNCYGNTCDSNSSATNGTVYGIDCPLASPVNKYIHHNSFTNHQNANGTTYCIYITDGNNLEIYDNKVLNVEGQGLASILTGIYVGFISGNGNIFIYNNMIGNLRPGGASSNTAVTGMMTYAGPTASQVGIYNNTVFLNANSSGANFGTAGFFVSKYVKNADLRNNIVVNTSIPNGTGRTVALLTDSVNFGNLSILSNNNNYYAGVPAANRLIFSDGVTDNQTMLSYRTRFYPREFNSISENPPFISKVNPVDLHLSNSVATQCESGGVAVASPMSLVNDIDGDARYPYAGYPVHPSYPAASCDIGADEFGGIPSDLTPPFISFAPLANIATMEDRTITATITDVHGVPASGPGLPRLCWKKNYTGTWTYITGNHAGGSTYTFTFGSGTALGDTVYYFIAAQDSWPTPNVGTAPLAGSGGYSANPPSASVVPSTPYSYVIVQPICGTFTVGTGGNYSTLTAAINDINTKGITCPVTLLLTSNSYNSETYPITLQPNGGSSEVNTLTIRPQAGVNPVFAGISPGSGILKVNGFDYLVIDGSPAGESSKNLTLYNASETNGAYTLGFFNKDRIKPATNNTIKNCIIRGKASLTAANFGVLFSSDGGSYENITLSGDSVYGAATAIQLAGNYNGINRNNRIMNNVIGSPTESKYITNKGIVVQYSHNTLISGNNIMGPAVGNNLPLQQGISLQSGSTATRIHGNIIHDFYRNADDGSGAAGIWYEAESNTVTEIFNNSIYAIKSSGAAPGPSPNNCYGIYVKSGGNIRIIHNSIYLTGNLLSPSGVHDASSACIGIFQDVSLTSNIEIRNNVMKNSQQGLFGQCPFTGRAYGIFTMATTPGNFSVIDNNDYFIDGCNGKVGGLYTTQYANLADWQAATGQEANSLGVDPVFTSSTLLIPTSSMMKKAGSYVTEVPVDITGALRTNPPDMGAYEFAYGMSAVTDSATNVTPTAATLNGTLFPAGQTANVFFDYGPTVSYGTSVAGSPGTVTGNGSIVASATIANLPAGTCHFRVRMVSFNGITVYGNDMTFSTVPDSIAVSGTAGSGNDDCYNATGVITVAGNGTTFIVENGGSATFIAGQKIRFLPGTKVLPGGYLRGMITTTGQYCDSMDNLQTGESLVKALELPEETGKAGASELRIYPNPATGSFTAELTDNSGNRMNTLEIFTSGGTMALTFQPAGERKVTVPVGDFRPGIYFVKITTSSSTIMKKLIKL